MVKGVNKQIIEINNTDSIYFEKAVFYLRPHINALPPDVSREEAEEYISQITGEMLFKKKRSRLWIYALLLLAAVAVVLIICR